MHIVWMLIIGLIAGALAKLVMPGKNPGGIIMTMLIGLAGSVLAGFAGRMIGHYQAGARPGIIASILGAIVLLGFYHLFLRVTHRGTSGSGPPEKAV
jgi:uncharacterized membrane protein YeaQ/YmgE (transglycosylase-associated protein family)